MKRKQVERKSHEQPIIEVIGGFIADAQCRGTEVDVLGPRVCELIATMVGEGRELFVDWEQWSQQRRMEWCFNGAMERAKLEFPAAEKQ